MQNILLPLCFGSCAFPVEAVASRLQLARFHASVVSFRHDNRRRGVEQTTAHTAQMEAVFTVGDAVAVQSHIHATSGIACVYEVARQIEVVCDHLGESVVCELVGTVAAPVGEGKHLPFGDAVGHQRRIVPLHQQFVAASVNYDMRLHAVAQQNLLQPRLQVHLPRISVLPQCHTLQTLPSSIAARSCSSL